MDCVLLKSDLHMSADQQVQSCSEALLAKLQQHLKPKFHGPELGPEMAN